MIDVDSESGSDEDVGRGCWTEDDILDRRQDNGTQAYDAIQLLMHAMAKIVSTHTRVCRVFSWNQLISAHRGSNSATCGVIVRAYGDMR